MNIVEKTNSRLNWDEPIEKKKYIRLDWDEFVVNEKREIESGWPFRLKKPYSKRLNQCNQFKEQKHRIELAWTNLTKHRNIDWMELERRIKNHSRCGQVGGIKTPEQKTQRKLDSFTTIRPRNWIKID